MEGDCWNGWKLSQGWKISIHTLRVEGDAVTAMSPLSSGIFQSTPSAWRVTKSGDPRPKQGDISIHTLRVEGDWDNTSVFSLTHHFNPHPPRGG